MNVLLGYIGEDITRMIRVVVLEMVDDVKPPRSTGVEAVAVLSPDIQFIGQHADD
jgi:hypothetical protein